MKKYFLCYLVSLLLFVAQADADAKIKRSAKAKYEFRKENPCPETGKTKGACPGWVIDHIKPLKRGGPDNKNNMQWMKVEDAKAKDRWE